MNTDTKERTTKRVLSQESLDIIQRLRVMPQSEALAVLKAAAAFRDHRLVPSSQALLEVTKTDLTSGQTSASSTSKPKKGKAPPQAPNPLKGSEIQVAFYRAKEEVSRARMAVAKQLGCDPKEVDLTKHPEGAPLVQRLEELKNEYKRQLAEARSATTAAASAGDSMAVDHAPSETGNSPKKRGKFFGR